MSQFSSLSQCSTASVLRRSTDAEDSFALPPTGSLHFLSFSLNLAHPIIHLSPLSIRLIPFSLSPFYTFFLAHPINLLPLLSLSLTLHLSHSLSSLSPFYTFLAHPINLPPPPPPSLSICLIPFPLSHSSYTVLQGHFAVETKAIQKSSLPFPPSSAENNFIASRPKFSLVIISAISLPSPP